MNKYPTEVTVIVYSVKNIKPKKKGLKYCVIFSVGSVKFRTDQVIDEDGNPEFNTESPLLVENPKLPLTLLVTEKKEKEIYGQLVIPLGELPATRNGKVISSPLQPHKKCQLPTATIHYEAWISKTLHTSEVVISMNKKPSKMPFKGLKKTLSILKHSPMLGRKNKQKMSVADGNMQQAYSCLDLYNHDNNNKNFDATSNKFKFDEEDNISSFSYGSEQDNENNNNDNPFISDQNSKPNPFGQPPVITYNNFPTSSSAAALSPTSPEINGVAPNSGLITGGTKIIIRGSRLGNSKEDIIGLFVCGSNVLSSLVYYSSSKITCTTKPWKLCTGPISIETQSGGKSASILQFTFKCDEESEFDSNGVKRSDSLNSAANRSISSTNLAAKSSPPAKKSSKLGNKLTLGLSNSFLSRSLMNLNDNSKDDKKVNREDDSVLLKVNGLPYKEGSYQDLESSSKPPCPPVVHIVPIMGDGRHHHKSKDTVKVDSTQLKELEQQLFTWQKCANNLTEEKKELETENQRLKSYIESLLLNVISKCPDVLCQDGGVRKRFN